MKSLVYFEDADADAMPDMLKKANWEEVKKFFEAGVRNLLKTNTAET